MAAATRACETSKLRRVLIQDKKWIMSREPEQRVARAFILGAQGVEAGRSLGAPGQQGYMMSPDLEI